MKETTDLLTRLCQPVVKRHRCLGLLNVRRHAAPLEQIESFGIRLQNQVHTAAKHNDLTVLGEKLLHIGRLDAGNMMGVGLLPVPFSAAAGIKLEVASCADAIDLHAAP